VSGWRVGLAFVLLMLASPASAQDNEAARRHFEQGVRLLEDSRFAGAARELEQSLALRDSPPAVYNLGLAYRGMGRYKQAIEMFERFMKTAKEPRYAPMRAQVKTELEQLAGGLARLSLEISGGASAVTVDRATVGQRDGTFRLTLDPGSHRVEVRKRGHRPVVRQLDLEPGSTSRLTLRADEHPLPARLVVETNVPEATIRLSGRHVARGRFDGSVDAGRLGLKVDAEGYTPFTRQIALAPGTTERVTVQLDQSQGGLLSSPWFWGGAALIVAGTATTLFVLTRPEEQEPDGGSLRFVVQALR
jgi:hypothetical protein